MCAKRRRSHDREQDAYDMVRSAEVTYVRCPSCGANQSTEVADEKYRCPICDVVNWLRRCPSCDEVVQVSVPASGPRPQTDRLTCPHCQKTLPVHKWRDSANALELHELLIRGGMTEQQLSDPTCRVVAGLLLEGGVFGLTPKEPAILSFESDQVAIHQPDGPQAVLRYEEITDIEIGGPGLIRQGGGFIGGGFGLVGFLEGALFAAVLNAATTKTSIQTVVFVKSLRGEVVFLSATKTPQDLRILLSPVFGRLAATGAHQRPPSASLASELARLADLHASGALTDSEFQQAKSAVLRASTDAT